MRKHFFKILAIIVSILCVILVGILAYMKFSNYTEKSKNDELSSKILDEISFIDYNVIDAMNKLNNISVLRYKVYTKNINDNSNNPNNASKKANDADNSSKGDTNQNSGNDSAQEQGQGSSDDSNQNAENSNSNENSSSLTKSNSGETNSNGKNPSMTESTLVNSLTETEDANIDWDTITSIYENLYSTWPTTQLDLKKAGVNDDYLENVNVDLNGIAQSILNKDKNSCLVNFYNLYAQIPNYIVIVTNDEYQLDLYNTKLAILNAYTLCNNDNKWNEMSSSIRAAKDYFNNVINVSNANEKDSINLEKIYGMLQNLENAVSLNNKNIFYMQYKNVIQELENV